MLYGQVFTPRFGKLVKLEGEQMTWGSKDTRCAQDTECICETLSFRIGFIKVTSV